MIKPVSRSSSVNFVDLPTQNTNLQTSNRMKQLGMVFRGKKYWGEGAWANFPGVEFDLKIEKIECLKQRIFELTTTVPFGDSCRVILIPGKWSLEKIRRILEIRDIKLPIKVDPQIEAQIKETEKATIYVVKTDTDDKSREGENFDLLTLVTLVATSYGTVKGKTVLFEGKTILCKDQIEGRNLAVTVTKDAINIAPCELTDPNLVFGTMLNAT